MRFFNCIILLPKNKVAVKILNSDRRIMNKYNSVSSEMQEKKYYVDKSGFSINYPSIMEFDNHTFD